MGAKCKKEMDSDTQSIHYSLGYDFIVIRTCHQVAFFGSLGCLLLMSSWVKDKEKGQ